MRSRELEHSPGDVSEALGLHSIGQCTLEEGSFGGGGGAAVVGACCAVVMYLQFDDCWL